MKFPTARFMCSLTAGLLMTAICSATAAAAHAGPSLTLKSLHVFDGTNGSYPTATMFKIDNAGAFATLHSFSDQDSIGTYPGSDPNQLYVIEGSGGVDGLGEILEVRVNP